MKKIKLLLLTGGILLFYFNARSQPFDGIGFRVGAGLSSQYWNYQDLKDFSGWKKSKTSWTAYLNSEKILNKSLMLRLGVGYIQKGYIDDMSSRMLNGEELHITDDRFILHDLSSNLVIKYHPFDFIPKPYLITGLRGDYLLAINHLKARYQGEIVKLNSSITNGFRKFTLSGLLGIGIIYNNLIYLELEYNPGITKIMKDANLKIRDRYLGLSMGLRIDN